MLNDTGCVWVRLTAAATACQSPGGVERNKRMFGLTGYNCQACIQVLHESQRRLPRQPEPGTRRTLYLHLGVRVLHEDHVTIDVHGIVLSQVRTDGRLHNGKAVPRECVLHVLLNQHGVQPGFKVRHSRL